jgi:hypothetical protein
MLRSRQGILSVVVLSLGLATVASALEFPKIDRRPAPRDLHRGLLESVPKYDPASNNPFQVDLRGCNLSWLDLREAGASLEHAVFDDQTVWPALDHLPKDLDRVRIMEMGKNPGLGVRSLHAQGITGRGVGIAMVDTPLLTEHREYAARLRLYEESNAHPNTEADMHGPAAASVAVGKTVGVAPEADLYFIAAWPMDLGTQAHEEGPTNFAHLARAVRRILQINDQLPAGRKIRVLSLSVGWRPGQTGYAEITQAVQEAKAAGMLVICSSVERVHGFQFNGLGRDLRADPNDFASYRPPREGIHVYAVHDQLLVPMGARTTASPSGRDDYVFCGEGGWSLCIPYLAGTYALAAQVDLKITPERFWALALKTGRTVRVSQAGQGSDLGPIVAPAQLVEALRRGDLSDPAAVAAELAKYYPPRTLPLREADAQVPKDLAARIDKLAVGSATRLDVIALFGEPLSYVRGKEHFDAGDLPSRFVMLYPGNVQVWVSHDRVQSIMIVTPGYLFRNAIQVGASQEEVFKVLEPPRKTMEVANDFDIRTITENPVFFQDLGGELGNGYYRSEAEGVGLYFRQGKVMQIYLLPQRPSAPVAR